MLNTHLALLVCFFLSLFSSSLSISSSYEYRNVTLPDVTLSVLFAGNTSQNADLILFLHGFPEGSWSWHGVLDTQLLDSYQLVAPDQRGYNRSSQVSGEGAYAIDALAGDMIALLATITCTACNVHLVAHDWGGVVAWWLAASYPQRFNSLTILNDAHPLGWISEIRTNPIQQADSEYVLFFVNPASTFIMIADNFAALKNIFSGEEFWTPDEEAAYVDSWAVSGSVDSALNWYRDNVFPHCPLNCTVAACWQQGAASTFDAMPANGIISIDTLILWGMKDSAFDNEGQLTYIQGKVTGTLNITRFPDNSHWIAQESPFEVARAIAGFISRHL